jgi:uncharacterized membrane protein
MNEVVPAGSDAEQASENERTTLMICYALQGAGVISGGLASIVGVIISHIKVNETQNDFIRSHHRWLIRTFWWSLAWALVSLVLCFIVIGVFGFFILAVWVIYRLVKGVINFTEKRPMPV